MQIKCGNSTDIEGAIRTGDGIDDCLYWRLVIFARRRTEKGLGIDYFGSVETQFLELVKRLLKYGANPFYYFKAREPQSPIDIACFNNHVLCQTLLTSKHVSKEVRHFVENKVEELTAFFGQGLLLDPIPRHGVRFLDDGKNPKEIPFCLTDVQHPNFASIVNKPSKNYINPSREQLSILNHALNAWERVANIVFKRVDLADKSCQIYITHRLNSEVDTDGGNQRTQLLDKYKSYVVLGTAQNVSQHSWSHQRVALHEIGHALGEHHPGKLFNMKSNNVDQIPYFKRNFDYTVMSYYRSPRGYLQDSPNARPITPMPLDIKFMQWLFGANVHANKQNDTYLFDGEKPEMQTLYDRGGVDTIDTSAYPRDVVINLDKGISYVGRSRIFIDEKTKIECVKTGDGNNLVYGNDSPNIIQTGAGNDIIFTGPGKSTLITGIGIDHVWIHPQATDITIEDCTQDVIDLTDVLKDTCLVAHVDNDGIEVTNTCTKQPATTITCGKGIGEANIVLSRTFYYFFLNSEYISIEILAGVSLGLLHVIATQLPQNKNANPLVKDISYMIFRYYLSKNMSMAHDITYSCCLNYMNKLTELEKQKKPITYKEHLKSAGNALTGFIQLGSIYLTTSLLTTFVTVGKQLLNPPIPPKKDEPRLTRWLKCSFFAIDTAIEKSMYFIPGGKFIMDALDEQEKAVIKYTQSRL